MTRLLIVALLLQFGNPQPLTPAETLLEPTILKALDTDPGEGPGVPIIQGSDPAAGEILPSCYTGDNCAPNLRASRTLRALVDARTLAQPARTIRFVTLATPAAFTEVIASEPGLPGRVHAAINVSVGRGTNTLQVFRSPWSLATIADEVVELFARQAGEVEVGPHRHLGQARWDAYGIPTIWLIAGVEGNGRAHAALVAAASAYFLATLPNAGAEALLSHLTVGAHARLAEDGRRAVAQMGSQQRASADVLIMFGQAIEREQRRMRSFERFMPAPVDAMLRSRIADMEKGITGVWTSIGITSSPFVPAAERIRGRGGEDRRVPVRTASPLASVETPGQFGKFDNAGDIIYELANFIDGKRSISDIRDAVSAEFGGVPLPPVVEYFERLAKAGSVTLR